jgi:glutathione S-transferase
LENDQQIIPDGFSDEGTVLNQNIAIHTYIADQAPERKLLPSFGSQERAVAMSWLSFVAADFHKAFGPLFALDSITSNEHAQGDIHDWAAGNVKRCLSYLDHHFKENDYLMGKAFTVADSYCFVIAGWPNTMKWMNISLTPYKNLLAYLTRVAQRPAVQKVLKQEGLFK